MTITLPDATHVRRAIRCADDCDAWKQLRYFGGAEATVCCEAEITACGDLRAATGIGALSHDAPACDRDGVYGSGVAPEGDCRRTGASQPAVPYGRRVLPVRRLDCDRVGKDGTPLTMAEQLLPAVRFGTAELTP